MRTSLISYLSFVVLIIVIYWAMSLFALVVWIYWEVWLFAFVVRIYWVVSLFALVVGFIGWCWRECRRHDTPAKPRVE